MWSPGEVLPAFLASCVCGPWQTSPFFASLCAQPETQAPPWTGWLGTLNCTGALGRWQFWGLSAGTLRTVRASFLPRMGCKHVSLLLHVQVSVLS